MITKKLIWSRWLCRSLLISAFLISVYSFLNTEKGLEVALLFGKQFLPGHLKINIIHGRLLGPIQIKGLYYTSKTISLYVSEAKLDWHWADLLQGQLNLESVFVEQLNLFVKQKINQKKLKSYQRKTFQVPKIFKYLKFNFVEIHQINVQTDDLEFILQGSIQQQWDINWHLNINELNNFIPNLQGKLALRGKIKGASPHPKLYIAFQKANLQWYGWQFKQIQVALNVDIKNKKWTFDSVADQLNNKIFKFRPLKLKLFGSLLPFSLQGNLSTFKLNKLSSKASQPNNISIPNTHISSFLSKRGLETSFQIIQGNKNQLFAYLLLPNYQLGTWLTSKQKINANIDLSLKDLTILTPLIPYLKNPKGIFSTELKFSGILNKPLFNLTTNLQASIDVPALGLNLKNIKFQWHTEKNNLLGIGQVHSGNGLLVFHTKTDLLKQNLPTLINLEGENITIIHNPEYRIIASPKLEIQANTRHIETHGFILFPKVRIKIGSKSNNLTKISNDVVFVEDNKKSAALAFSLKNNIKIEAGNDIRLQYHGLNTRLKGSLTIKQDSDHPILATGQLKLFPGEYNYYGQILKLNPNSSLNFANNPLNNPILNITASRNILILPVSTPDISTDIKSKLGSNNFIQSELSSQSTTIQLDVGLHLRGMLQNPKIILFANPSNIIQSQLDLLSYLITGQASNRLSAASAQLLLNAATNLGNEKNNIGQLISKIQQKIGLDLLTIGTKPIFDPTINNLQQNTSLIIGKNLSPNLNISYSLGLLDQISILEINYFLNKNFSLQTTSTNFANSLNLFFKFEKN